MTAEGFKVKPNTDPSAEDFAVDIGADGKLYQGEQPVFGPDGGVKIWTDDVDGERFPVGGAQIGAVNETAPASDIAPSGLNGRFQRVAQNISTLFGYVGSTTDAIVAAGAAGTLAAKLRRVTQGLEDLKTLTKILRNETTGTSTVTAGGQTGTAVDCRGYNAVGIMIPTNFDGSSIQFNVSTDNITYQRLYLPDNSAAVSMSVTPLRSYPLWVELAGWNYIQVVAVTVQAGTDTVFTLQLKS